jgi:hypothetical protein
MARWSLCWPRAGAARPVLLALHLVREERLRLRVACPLQSDQAYALCTAAQGCPN